MSYNLDDENVQPGERVPMRWRVATWGLVVGCPAVVVGVVGLALRKLVGG